MDPAQRILDADYSEAQARLRERWLEAILRSIGPDAMRAAFQAGGGQYPDTEMLDLWLAKPRNSPWFSNNRPD